MVSSCELRRINYVAYQIVKHGWINYVTFQIVLRHIEKKNISWNGMNKTGY
jgi:hypothetical protein